MKEASFTLCLIVAQFMVVRLGLAQSPFVDSSLAAATQASLREMPPVYRERLSELERSSPVTIDYFGAAKLAGSLSQNLGTDALRGLEVEAGHTGYHTSILASFTLAKMGNRPEAYGVLARIARDRRVEPSAFFFQSLGVADVNVARAISELYLRSHDDNITLGFGATVELLAITGNQDSVPILEALRRPDRPAEYRNRFEREIEELRRIVSLSPVEAERQRENGLKFWFARTTGIPKVTQAYDYSAIAANLARNEIHFPVEFLLTKLPTPDEDYRRIDGWLADPVALTIAILAEQNEASAIDRLRALRANPDLQQLVDDALRRIADRQR